MISCGDLYEQKRPDRGDPDGGDSENDDGSCEKNDGVSTEPVTKDQSEATKHPIFNLPSPFKAIDLRTVFKIYSDELISSFTSTNINMRQSKIDFKRDDVLTKL